MSRESKKERLLILGSGFSKAVSDKMPVVRELAQALQKQIETDPGLTALKEPQYQHLLNDPEMLLTYLAQDQLWKQPWEAPKEWSLYLKISKWLAEYIRACESRAFEGQIDDWVKQQLPEWLEKTKTSVITFNYDTVLERIYFLYLRKRGVGEPHAIIFNSYRMPLAPIQSRMAGVLSGGKEYMFHLIKLHGSTNWFYSGVGQFPGEQIYCRLVDSEFPYKDDISENSDFWGISPDELEILLSDKVPFIIPPVAEKSRFYANQTIRSLWGKAREYLAQAEEIYCVGYSLPDTDLTVKLLLQTACAGRAKTVYIVNNDVKGKEDLVRRYRDAFPKEVAIKDDYIRADAVEAMIKDLCKEG